MVASVKELNKRVITSFLLILLLIFTIKVSFFLFIVLFFTFCEIFYEFYYILNKIFKKHKLKLYINLIFFLFYLTLCILIIWSNLNSKNDLNIIQIFLIISICVATDIGGYIFGNIFKGKKLTKISPKKTYSGMIGSYISSLIVSYVFFNNYFTIENLFIISLVISSVSQIGDLSISYLKRKSKMKDTGKILPGHGGLLDRFDGLILAVPFGYLFLNIL